MFSSGQMSQHLKHMTQRYTSTCPTSPWTTTQPPSMARLCIKQSKTDPFRQGCVPWQNWIGGMSHSGTGALHRCPQPIAGPTLHPPIRSASHPSLPGVPTTGGAGIEDSRFNGHSFRIGAAITAAQQGLEDSLIQTLGRWRSDAYKIYIKLPRSQLASVSKTLTQ